MYLQTNKRKRLIWCKEQLRVKEDFTNVIFTDECTVQLESYSRICFRKRYQPRILKQRAKHPVKLHIWERISNHGATNIITFTGIMNAERLRAVFQAGFLPCFQNTFPDGHHLQQDNDPKHASCLIDEVFEEKTM